jgi:hypothetical protein
MKRVFLSLAVRGTRSLDFLVLFYQEKEHSRGPKDGICIRVALRLNSGSREFDPGKPFIRAEKKAPPSQ